MKLAAACVVAIGCSAMPMYMHPTAVAADLVDPAHATVVFVHHSEPRDGDCAPGEVCARASRGYRYAGNPTVRIVDENAQFLGDSAAGTSFAVAFAPGQHWFVGWLRGGGGGVETIEANLDAGRVYFIDVRGSRARVNGSCGRSGCRFETTWRFRPIHSDDLVDPMRIADGTSWVALDDGANEIVGGELDTLAIVGAAMRARPSDVLALEDGYR